MGERITNIKIMQELSDLKLKTSNNFSNFKSEITSEFNDCKLEISDNVSSIKSDLRTHIAYHKSNGKQLAKIYNDFYEKDGGAMFKLTTLWNKSKSRKSFFEKVILTIIAAIIAFVAGTYYR